MFFNIQLVEKHFYREGAVASMISMHPLKRGCAGYLHQGLFLHLSFSAVPHFQVKCLLNEYVNIGGVDNLPPTNIFICDILKFRKAQSRNAQMTLEFVFLITIIFF